MIAALRTLATRAAGLVLGAVLALAATDAAAQRAFTSRFTANANGDILMIGNANMSCPTGAANCAAARAGGNFADNDFTMADIDIDSDATTFNSSSADLSLPAGSTVLWAGLYWGANTGAAARNQVLLQRPFGFGYQVINASQVDTTGGTEYGAFADVTSIVQAGGSGTYMVANIQRTLGANQWAGWSLIVAYQNNGETLKNLTVFDGFQLDPVTTTVSGFLTPLSGPITTRLGFVGYDGDRDDTSAGEAFTINGVPIVDGQNPALNFYNSTISNLGSPNTARNPAYDNTLGLDIDRVQAPAGALGNGATSATIQLGAANEQIWIHVVAFATDIYVPIITPNVVKTATDLNGGSLNRGDTIRYNITLSNTGQDTGTNVILTDPIPANTTYVPGSLVITAGANAGAKSDTAGNDQAEFLTGPNRVVFRLGTGANATNGGNIAFGQSTAVQFDVTVDAATPPGAQISNTATISYSGQTLGASFGTTSAAANATVMGPPAITKSFTPNGIGNGGTSVLTLVVSNPAANPSNLTGVTFSDTYPANLVNTGAPSPNITCTAGSTAGTVTAAPGGNSVALSPGATIAPGGSCTVTVNVTSTTDGAYSNTTGAVTSTNGGTGNTANAVLSVGKPRITKAIAPATILSGGVATVTLTVQNPTAMNLTSLTLFDSLSGMQLSGTPNASNTCGGTFTATPGGTIPTLNAGTLAAGASCTISFDVTSTSVGVQSNTTSGASSAQTAPAGNPSNTVTLTVIGAPVITKSFSPTSVNLNVPSQMTITVTNPNPTTTLTGVAFTDTYPDPDGAGAAAQMRNDTPSNRTFNCTAGSTGTVTGGLDNGTTVGLTAGSLAPNGSCTITVNVESSAITGTSLNYNNTTGTVTSTNAGTGAAANATLTVATLTPPTVTKAFAPANVAPGATSVMTITLTNPNGATAVTGVNFTDTYPSGLVNTGTPNGATTCPAGTVTAAANGSSVSFSGGTIAAGGNCTITVNVTSPLAGSRFNATGNIVTANAGTRTPGATATLNVLQPPEIEKVFAPTSVATNGDSTLTFTLTNFNNVALTGVGFTDTFPVGTSARGAPAPTNTCGGTWQDSGGGAIGNGDAGVRLNNNGTIPANGTCTLTVTVRGTAAGTYNNVSGAVTATGPIALTGNTASATLAVGQLGIVKSFATSPIAVNATSLLTFSITNSTGAARTGLAFTDTYPAGLVNATPLTVGGTCTGITHTATAGGGTFNVTAANVAAGGCTITVLVTSATPGTYDNQTSGATYTGDPTPGAPSNVASLVVRQRPIAAKSFAPTAVTPGAASTLTITITNNNGDAMTGVAFTDTFPAGMVVATPLASSNTCGGTLLDSGGGALAANDVGISLAAGSVPANTTCTITVNVSSATPATYNNTTSTITTTNASTGTAASATLVVAAPPTVSKSFAPSTVGLNGTSTLTITLTNPNGSVAVTGAAFTDVYPAGMVNDATPNASSSCGGSVSATGGGNSLALTGGTIPAGGNCAVTVTVTATAAGALLNSTGAVTTTNAGTGTSANGTLTVLNLLTVTKAFNAATVGVGQASVLTITLTNPNTTAVTGAAFSDTYPANLVNTAAAGGATTCGGSPTVTAANNGTSVSVSGATVPASGSCTVTVNVLSNTAGTYNNTTGLVTTTNAGTAAAANGTLTVREATLSKAFGAASINDGAATTLVYTFTNGAGNPAQAGIGFTDTLRTGLAINSATPALTYSAGCSGPANGAYVAGTRVLTLSGIALANTTASCTVTVAGVTNQATQLNAACPAVNFTNGAADIGGLTRVNTTGMADVCLVVNAVAPTVAKSFLANPINDGVVTSLVFTLTNQGTNPAQSGIAVGDTLPTSLRLNTATPAVTYSAGCSGPATAAYNAGTRVLSGITGVAMTAGTASCTITVAGLTNVATAVNASCAANPAAFTNLQTSITTTNATATGGNACLVVNTVAPGVAKTFGAGTINDNATTTLVFTLTNSGTNPAQSGIALGDTLPTGLRLTSATPAVAYSAGCSGPATAAYNTGTRVLSGLTGIAMTATTASCTVTIAGLTNTATQVNATCPAANFTNAAASVTTTNATNNSTDQCLVVTRINPSVAKTFGAGTIADGAATTLVFTFTNSGSNPAQSGLAVGDTLPTGLAINSATPAVAYSAGCSGPATAAYNAGTRVLSGLTGIAMTAGTASCTATVSGLTNAATQVNATCPSANFTNASASVTTTGVTNASTDQCLVVTRANPNVAKTFGAASINDNATTTLVFTLTNTGTNPAQSGITVGDTLPTGLRLNSATPAVAYSAGCSGPATAAYNAGTRVLSGLTGVAMTAGTASCTVTVAGLTNTATQTNASCVGNPAAFTNAAASVTTTGAGNTSTDQCLVVNTVAPGVAKTFGAGTIADGASTTLVFTLTNSGSNPAQSGIALGDTLPTGLRLSSATPAVAYSAGCAGPATGAYNAGTRVLSGLTGITMTAGTASCTVTVSGLTNTLTQVNATCPSANFTNSAAAVTTTNATNNSTDQCVVVTRANPSVAKTFGAGTINDNATTTLVFTLTNSGTNPAQAGLAVGDTLPTGLRLNSATPAVAYSAGCSGPATGAYNAGTRVLSGITGVAMTAGTASCTVTVAGLTNTASQTNLSCVGNPAAFTNTAAAITTTSVTNASGDVCLVVNPVAPGVAKTFGAAAINDNATTTLVFTLTNSGSNPAQSGIALGDTLPTGLRFTTTTPAVTYSAGCSGPATAAYNTGTRVLSGITGVAIAATTASCTVTVAGLTNTATQLNATCPAANFTNAAAAVTTTNATNNSTDQCLVVNRVNPSVAKTFGAGTIADGAATTLVFTLTNSGSNPAQSGIALGDTLPTGLAINSATPAVAYSAGCSGPATAAYNAGTRVLSGLTGIAMTATTASCTVTVAGLTNAATQVNATCPAANFTNTAAAVTTTGATNASTDQCLVVTRANPNVAKTFGAASINDNATTTLVFTLTNTGTNPAQSGIAVGDTLPTSLRLNSTTPAVTYSAGCSGPATAAYNTGTRVLSGITGVAMTAGTASCTVTVAGLTNVAAQVNATCPSANFTNAAASVTTTGATNTSTDQCLVVNTVAPGVVKTFGAASINDNTTTTLVFTLTNSGSNPAQSGIALGDTLPTGLRLNSATPAVVYSAGCSGPAAGAYNAGTRVLSGLTGIAMTAGTVSCTITVAGLTNQATQSNTSCVGNPAAFTNTAAGVTTTNATNNSTDVCLVVNPTAPSAAKTFGAATIADTAATTLVFTLTNSGTNPAQTGIALGDTLPTALRLNSATPAVAYSAGCSGPATAAYNAGTRVLSGITGVAMTAGTASCTVTVAGLTNVASQTNASCAATPAAFTNAAASVTTTNATNTSTDQCLVVTAGTPSVAKTFGAASITDGAATTLVFTLTNSGSNPAQSGIAVGDTLPTGLAINSATPAVAYSAGCSGPATAAYNAGTRVLSGLTGIAMTATTASCTVTVSGLTNAATQVNPTCPSANFTNAAASVTTTGATNTSTDQCLVVNRVNPSVAKTFGAAAINDGAATTLVFTLTNSGTNPAQSGVTVGDTLPTGLAINSATPAVAYSAGCSGPATAAYNAGTRVLSGLTGLAMTAGTTSCTVTVSGVTNQAGQVNGSCAATPAAFTNAATSVTTTGATNTSIDRCLVVDTVAPSAAKTFGAAAIADGGTTTLVFTLTNTGTNPAQAGIALGDTLPTSLRINSATPAVAYSAGCSGPATGAYNAGTRVLSGLTGIAIANGTASCTVTVAGVTNVAAATNPSCVASPAAFTNAATSVTTTNATNTSIDRCLVVTAGTPTVAKTFGAGTFADGAATTLVFTLTNGGTSPAQAGIAVGDTLPSGLQLSSATPAVAYSAGCSGPANGAYNAGTRVLSGITGVAMTAGTASCTITVAGLTNQAGQVNATCPSANFTNLAANVTSTNATNASVDQCVVVTAGTPSVAKTFGAGTIADGAATTLVFTFTNTGTNPPRAGLAVGDTLPTGLAINSATPALTYSAGCSGPANGAYNAGTRVLSGVTGIAIANGTASCSVTVAGLTNAATQVNPTCPAANFTNASAAVTTTGATNTSTDQCLVVTRANPSVAKTFGAGTIADGAATTLVFTLTNSGTNPAQSAISLGDTLPTGLQLSSATPAVAYSAGCSGPAAGAYNAGTRVLSGITGVAMTAGTASCTVTVAGLTNQAGQVNGSCAGNPAAFTNTSAAVTATGATNTSTDQCLVVTAGTPTVAKTFGAGTIADGATTTLVFTFTNTGTNPARAGIVVGDTLPTGLAINSATPAVTYSAGCSGPANGAYNAGTRVLSGLTGIAIANGTASCTATVTGVTNQATQTNASCVGNPAAFTNASAAVTSTNATNASTDQCLVVTAGTPGVAKTFGTNTLADGATTTLVFTLTNTGTNPARAGIVLGDTLPTGLQLSSATPAVAYSAGCSGPATAAYNAGTRVLSGLTGIAMAATTASCTVTVAGLTNAAGQVNATCPSANFTNLAANVTATNATPGGADQCMVVNAGTPTVAKTFGTNTLADGAATTLVFTFTNTGTNPARAGLVVGDTLPTGLAINSATPAVAYSAGCSGPANAAYNAGTRVLSGLTGLAIANGTANCSVTVSGLTNTATQTNATCPSANFTNLVANVTATGATPAGTDQCMVVTAGTPTVAKTFGAGTFADGAATTLVFTLTNTGTNPARAGISVGDTLPTGLQLSSATPAVAYSAGCSGPAAGAYNAGTRVLSGITGVAMTAGTASCTITVSGLTNQAGQVNATCPSANFTNLAANVTATNATPAGTDQCVVVTAGTPSVAKTFGTGTITDGAATTLVFTFTNTGTNPPRAGLAVGDTLPTGLAINSATPALTYSAGCSGPANGAYNAGTRVLSGVTGIAIANGTASCSVTVAGLTNAATQVNPTCPAANFTNASAAVTATGATNASTDQCLVVNRVNPSVAKTFGAGTIADAGTTTLVFTLTNTGTNPAQPAISLGDTLPTSLRLASATPAVTYSAGCSGPATAAYNAGTRVLSGLTGIAMAAGTASCTVTVAGVTNVASQVNASCAGNPAAFTNAAASVTATNATNASTDQCLVVTAGTVTVAKTFGAAAITDGTTTTLVFTLTNGGTSPAQSGIAIGDTLPSGLRLNSATPAVAYSAGCSGPATGAYNAGTGVLSGLTGIAVTAGTASCTVTVAGLTNTAGQVNATCPAANFTNLAANVTATNAAVGGGNACLVVNRVNPVLSKAFAPSTIDAGGTSTLVFTLTNQGTNPAQSGIDFTDTLPAGVVVAGTPNVQSNCPAGGALVNNPAFVATGAASITVTGAAMNSALASCEVRVNVTAAANGSYTNNATNVTGTANVDTTGLTATLTVQTLPVLTKAFSTPTVAIGATSTLVFTISNTAAGSVNRTGLAFTDALTARIAIANPAAPTTNGNCGAPAFTAVDNTQPFTASGIAVNAGQTCVITLAIRGITTGIAPNATADVTTTGLVNNVGNQSITVNAAAPTLQKTFTPATIASGGTSTLTVRIDNPNAAAITVTTATDTFPAGLVRSGTPAPSTTCAGGVVSGGAGTLVLTGGTVPANGFCTFQVNVTAATQGSYVNTIQATDVTTSVGNAAANASATLTVSPVANVSIVKNGPATIGSGATITYTLVISNAGPDAANAATYADTVPAAVSGVTAGCGSPTGGAACGAVNVAGNSVTGSVTTLPAGGSVTITIQGTVVGAGGISNTATVAAPGGVTDPDNTNNSSTVATTILAPDLTLSKTHVGNFTVGVNGTYTLTVANPGTLATSGTVTVTDTLPSGLGFVSGTGTGWACGAAGQVVTCTSATPVAAAGTGNPITLTVTVASTAVPSVLNTATVSGGGEPPVNASNNFASDNTIVVRAAQNTFAPDNAQTSAPGTVVFYPHVFNAGLAGTVGFSTTNLTTPAVGGWSNEIFRDTNCNGVLDGAEGVAPITGTVAVNPGDQVCIVVKDSIPVTAPYNGRNVISVTSTFNGTQTITRTDTTTVGAAAGAGLTLQKSVRNVTLGSPVGTTGTARPNDVLEYTIVYTNTSAGPVSSIVVTDATPAFTTFLSAACVTPLPASLTACNTTSQPAVNGAGSVVWTLTGPLLSNGSGSVTYQVRVAP